MCQFNKLNHVSQLLNVSQLNVSQFAEMNWAMVYLWKYIAILWVCMPTQNLHGYSCTRFGTWQMFKFTCTSLKLYRNIQLHFFSLF